MRQGPFPALARSSEDKLLTYADADINAVLRHLGIRWEPSKVTLFGSEVPYLGFCGDLHAHTVRLLVKKRVKYLAVSVSAAPAHFRL